VDDGPPILASAIVRPRLELDYERSERLPFRRFAGADRLRTLPRCRISELALLLRDERLRLLDPPFDGLERYRSFAFGLELVLELLR
jgi:hypothetical protein